MVHTILKITLFRLVGMFIKRVKGFENVPKEGGFIIIANHESYMDPLLISSVITPLKDKKVHYLARSKYTRTFGRLFEELFYKRITETIIMHENFDKDEIINKAQGFLKKGDVVGIFPKIPETGEVKTGFVRLSLETKAPIVLIKITGASKIAPLGANNLPLRKRIVKPHKAEIRILKPVHLSRYHNRKLEGHAIRRLAEDIYSKIEKG